MLEEKDYVMRKLKCDSEDAIREVSVCGSVANIHSEILGTLPAVPRAMKITG